MRKKLYAFGLATSLALTGCAEPGSIPESGAYPALATANPNSPSGGAGAEASETPMPTPSSLGSCAIRSAKLHGAKQVTVQADVWGMQPTSALIQTPQGESAVSAITVPVTVLQQEGGHEGVGLTYTPTNTAGTEGPNYAKVSLQGNAADGTPADGRCRGTVQVVFQGGLLTGASAAPN
jgi:hypothetical protein